jgi:UDP-glucose:(heptosyl)LPS alpha-1,3-glucosyltransferase
VSDSLDVTVVAHDVGPVGGMERQLTELITGLLARGHRVHVVSRRCTLPAHPQLRWIRVRCPRRPFVLYYPWFFIASAIAVRRHGRGIVHTTGAMSFAKAHVSTVHFCHHAFDLAVARRRSSRASLPYRLNAFAAATLSRWAERWCYRPAVTRTLVPVSGGVAGELERWFPGMRGRIHAIPNGVDRDRFRPDPEARRALRDTLGYQQDELLALFVGGEWERKGLRFAIEALAEAPEWRLVVVGAGNEEGFDTLARAASVADRVTFVGRRTDTPAFYAAADAFVLPTEYEAFPLVVLEAAAAGVPLLVTPVNGATELVTDGETGWTIERDAAVIADCLRRLGRAGGRDQGMGAAARRRTEPLSWNAVVDRYVERYRDTSATSADERG